jgi:hypothetical protein
MDDLLEQAHAKAIAEEEQAVAQFNAPSGG